MKATTEHADNIRDQVRNSYATAVTAPASGCGCSGATPKGVASKLAGYTGKEVCDLPQDAVANSFGCGNPVAFSQVQPGQVVLDLGSGAGLDLLLAARKVGPKGRAIGIDMTPEMIERARANIAEAGITNAEVRQGFIEDLPVESGTVDWVISNCVINLSPEKPRVFAEIARVLKPGGRMLVSDIMVKDLPQWVRENKALYSSCISGSISEEEYLTGLEKAGMSNVEVMARLVYDTCHMAGLVKSEMPEAKKLLSCCGQTSDEAIDKLAASVGDELQGKVWSATVYAQKPAR